MMKIRFYKVLVATPQLVIIALVYVWQELTVMEFVAAVQRLMNVIYVGDMEVHVILITVKPGFLIALENVMVDEQKMHVEFAMVTAPLAVDVVSTMHVITTHRRQS